VTTIQGFYRFKTKIFGGEFEKRFLGEKKEKEKRRKKKLSVI
jgi:hypothetical protein